MTEEERQAIVDAEHLRVLSIGYVVMGAANAFFSLFGLLYAGMGGFLTTLIDQMPQQPGQSGPPEAFGWIFMVFGLGVFTLMATMALMKFFVASQLRRRRSHTLCLIVAGITCLGIPYGTALGVATFLVLLRPSVNRTFDPAVPAAPSA